jgi:uncharacterized protein YdeI (YjbR/CyaY-like superfamily)
MTPEPRFFRDQAAFRRWLEKNHEKATELWVGYHKVATGKPSMTWAESVDEALCFGWIDGVRRSLGPDAHTIRFTPRRAGSNWSAKNVRRVPELIELGQMRPAGLAAFEARRPDRTGNYSYENRPADLPKEYERAMRADKRAWAFWREWRRAIDASPRPGCFPRDPLLVPLLLARRGSPVMVPERAAPNR